MRQNCLVAELESPNFATKLNFVAHMTDYEYILEQCRQFNEIFADEEFVNHGIHGYDNVISIKGCRLTSAMRHPARTCDN